MAYLRVLLAAILLGFFGQPVLGDQFRSPVHADNSCPVVHPGFVPEPFRFSKEKALQTILDSEHFVLAVGNDPSFLIRFQPDAVKIGVRKKCSVGAASLDLISMVSAGYENNCRRIRSGFVGCNRSDSDEGFNCLTVAVHREDRRKDGKPIDEAWIKEFKAKRAYARCTRFISSDAGVE